MKYKHSWTQKIMNKQSLTTILLTVLMSMAGAKAFAHDIAVKNDNGVTIRYKWTNNKTELSVSYDGYDAYDTYLYGIHYTGNVVIPKSVNYNGNTYPVTSIGNGAFMGCRGLTSITIPNSVTSIGSLAFDECIGLTSVTIPASVTSIGESAFLDCSGLTSVTIPASVTSIGESAFSGCSGLTFIKVESGNQKYDSRNNCNAIIEKSSNTLIAGCKNTIIPNSVTSIAKRVFYKCSGLTSVTIPNSVTSIGSYAFSSCSGLTSVTIPNSVTSIDYYPFSGCSGLTSVTIPNSVTSIGFYAFSGCTGLTSLTIPNSVTSIDYNAFEGCSGLTSVTIGNSLTSIGNYAFWKCSGLSSVNISDLAAWCNIEFSGIESNPLYYAHHLYINGNEITNLVIPSGVTSIGNYTFRDCSGLTSVTIPASVTNIGGSAFYSCTSIQFVKSFISEPYSLDRNAFPDIVYRQSPLYIPAGTEKLYTRFDGWKEFLKIEEMDGSEGQEIPGADKCATPTIIYENNKLSFSCQTVGVEYKYKIESDDVKEGYGNDIKMTRDYKVTVTAIKDGMNNSDPAIIIIGKKGDVNGDNKVDVADHVALSDIIMGSGAKTDGGGVTPTPVNPTPTPVNPSNDDLETDKIKASFTGGAYIKLNDQIQSGSKLNVKLSNRSGKSITLTGLYLIDGQTKYEGSNLLSENVNVPAGADVAYTLTVGLLGITKPIVRFIYSYNGKTYQVEGEWKD